MPARNRTPAEIAADHEFFIKARARSPRFPSIVEALEKRRRLQETIAARSLLAMFVVGLLYGIFVDNFGFVAAGFGFVGFITTCFVAGSRANKRNGGDRHASRPF